MHIHLSYDVSIHYNFFPQTTGVCPNGFYVALYPTNQVGPSVAPSLKLKYIVSWRKVITVFTLLSYKLFLNIFKYISTPTFKQGLFLCSTYYCNSTVIECLSSLYQKMAIQLSYPSFDYSLLYLVRPAALLPMSKMVPLETSLPCSWLGHLCFQR